MTTTTTTRDMESAQNTSLDMFWDIGMFFFFFFISFNYSITNEC